MNFHHPVADGESILSALGASSAGLAAGLFLFDESTRQLELKSVVGFLDEISQRKLAARIASVDDPESLLGSVSRDAEASYVADCESDPRWKLACRLIGSAYLIPLAEHGPCPVLALYSREGDAFSENHRALADALVRHSRDGAYRTAENEQKVQRFEAGLRGVAQRLEELGICSDPERRPLPNDLLEELRGLTPREWEVFRSFAQGHRVSTISRNLAISSHTVRNHLKSIFRKLKVSSQAELSERIRPWDLPQALD